MQVVSAESTELFVGPPNAPVQLARVTVAHCTEPTPLRIDGDGLSGEVVVEAGDEVVELPVTVDNPVVGQRRAAQLDAAGSSLAFEFEVAEPGWTMFMVSHFHYDPVWWNTQGAYTSEWREDPPGRAVRPTASNWCTRIWRWPAASPNTSSCWPKSTTSSRTGTPAPRTAPTCAGFSRKGGSR